MKPVICNHGNNEAFVSLIKSPCSPGATWSMFVWKSKGTDAVCSNTFFFFFFPGKLSLASQHPPQRWREGAPLHVSCWNSMCQHRFPERRFMAFHLWRWGNHQHKQEADAARNQTPQWKCMKKLQRHSWKDILKKKKSGTWNRSSSKWAPSHKRVHVLKSHVPITALLSSEAFIINAGNHRRLLIGDALVDVSEVSGVLSLSICKLPRLGEKSAGRHTFMCASCWLWRM